MHHEILLTGIAYGVIDLDLQGHFLISNQDSKKQHSTSLLYIDLGRPRGITRPNVLLLLVRCWERFL